MGRHKFTLEFKLGAIKLVKQRGVSASQAARALTCVESDRLRISIALRGGGR